MAYGWTRRSLTQLMSGVGLCMFGSTCATAQWYAGAGAGWARHDIASPPERAFATTSLHDESNDAAAKVYIGRRLGSSISVELAYQDYGSALREVNACVGCTRIGGRQHVSRSSRSARALHLDLLGEMPVARSLGAIAGIGVSRMRIKTREESGFLPVAWDPVPPTRISHAVDNGTAVHLTLGLSWKINEAWRAQATIDCVGVTGNTSVEGEPASGEARTSSAVLSLSRTF